MEEKAKEVVENLDNKVEQKTENDIEDEDFDEDDEDLEEDDIDEDDVSDDDNDEDEDDDENTSTSKSQEDEEKEKEKAKNARFAEMRRKKEAEEKAKRVAEEKAREQKIRDDATLKAKLEVIKKNPYTEEPIVDEEDLKIYEIQKQLEDEGKDPVADLPKRLADIERRKIQEAKAEKDKREQEEKSRSEKIRSEIQELREKYPKLNTVELANDPLFQECLKGRAGRWTQVEIYEFYLEKKKAAAEKAKAEKDQKVIDENGTKISKTPSSKANGGITSKSVSDMSKEEFEAYWKAKYKA